jgi:hypothetical protein
MPLDWFALMARAERLYSRQESPQSADENLWQIDIDAHTGAPTSSPKRITQWVGQG